MMSSNVLPSGFRVALLHSRALSRFCNLVVNSLDFYSKFNLPRVHREPLEQNISLGYQLFANPLLIACML